MRFRVAGESAWRGLDRIKVVVEFRERIPDIRFVS